MIKKWEKQIPIQLPDSSFQLASEASEVIEKVAVDEKGNFYRAIGKDKSGFTLFSPIASFEKLCAEYIEQGKGVELHVPKNLEFQKVISLLDRFQENGLKDVSLRLGAKLHSK